MHERPGHDQRGEGLWDAVISMDAKGHVTGWNAAAEVLYGFTGDEALGRPAATLLHNVYPEGMDHGDLGTRLEAEGGWSGELEQVAADGRALRVRTWVTAMRGPSGEIIGYAAVNRDEGADRSALGGLRRRLAQAEAISELARSLGPTSRGSERSLAAVVRCVAQSTGDVVFFLRGPSHAATLEAVGLDRPRCADDQRLYAEVVQWAAEGCRRAAAPEAWLDLGLTVDGELIGRLVLVRPVAAPRALGDLAFATALAPHVASALHLARQNQRRRAAWAELEARSAHLQRAIEQQHRLAEVVRAAHDLVLITDREGVVEYANPAYLAATSFTEREVLGRRAALTEVGSGLCTRVLRTLDAAKAWRGTMQVACSSGEALSLEVCISQVPDTTPRSLVWICRDMTVEREAEVRTRHAQKMQAIGQLAAGIAHELNTPAQYVNDNISFLAESAPGLVALLAGLKALEADLSPPNAQRLRALLDSVDADFLRDELPGAIDEARQGVRRIADIVGAMKAFSHPGTSTRQPVDLNETLRRAAMVARSEWKHVAELSFDLDPDLPPVPGLAGDLGQVFLNLLVNAAHAVRAHPREGLGRISVGTRAVGDWAQIWVQDDGVGVSEEVRDRIFEPFFTTKALGEGTGQGLALAHAVTAAHGGRVSLEAVEGPGARFCVRLPLAGTEVVDDDDAQGAGDER